MDGVKKRCDMAKKSICKCTGLAADVWQLRPLWLSKDSSHLMVVDLVSLFWRSVSLAGPDMAQNRLELRQFVGQRLGTS